MELKIKRLVPEATIPTYARPGDAGMDITATSMEWNLNGSQVTYGTGLAFEIPQGFVGLLFPRSSICKTGLQLSNAVGVLDSSYRGEVKFKFNAQSYYAVGGGGAYAVGDRIGQLMILHYPKVELTVVQELSSTERGTGGFGSTDQQVTNTFKGN